MDFVWGRTQTVVQVPRKSLLEGITGTFGHGQKLDNAHGGPNRHSDISSDDEGVLLRPVFHSTPVPKTTQQKSKHVSSKTEAPVEEFVNSLYGKVETHTL
ncbi:hypothetical protein P5673_030493 [Acropora cervicornis]|uniref:Uncharacterized protein n=1 Tax=Acropora cervicornis TaxID=6130 RepID=A0AAD9PU32_ACRCE|nr:hypothetical protein P5673_030493 [Acropora cervicornis]